MKTRTLMRTLALLALAACSGGSSSPPADTRTVVAVIAPVPNNKVDLLFMIDDSTGAIEYQTDLMNALPLFMNRLNTRPAGFPDVHIGVVTSDLGTSAAGDATPGPTIGSGPGMCAGTGKNGLLQGNSTYVPDRYISDEIRPDGVRVTNYVGFLGDALASLVAVGAGGCGFEQHLEAVRRALENTTDNHGFLRPDANLAVVLVGDEDDCSMEHSTLMGTDTSLGPLQSFRCTRFGVTCDDGGATPDAMNTPGAKDHCHANDTSQYLTHVADYKAFLEGLKPDPLMVMVGAIVGDPEPVSVDLRAPPGGGTPIPALAHSCTYQISNNTLVADPAVRDVELASMFDRHFVGSICQQDLSAPVLELTRQIDIMTGAPCLFRDVPEPRDCVATDDAGPVPACVDQSSTDCYVMLTDPTTCPEGQHQRLAYIGTQTSKLTLSCKLP